MVEMNRKFLLCFGVRDGFTSWKQLMRYNKAALKRSTMLDVSEQALDVTDALSYPPFRFLAPLSRFFQWLTIVQLPPRLAKGFNGGRAVTKVDYVLFALLVARIRFLYRFLPTWLRWITPYHRLAARFEEPSRVKKYVTESIGAMADYALWFLLPKRDAKDVKEWLEENRRQRPMRATA